MSAVRPSLVCERVRAQVSLELDGELSQLERRMVAAHLQRCADCRSFEEALGAFTLELRAAPLEVLPHPVVVRAPRRVSLTATPAAVAAALAIAVLGVVSQLQPQEPRSAAAVPTVTPKNLFRTTWRPEQELARIDSGALSGPHTQGPRSAV
jgi:anti-sigma factor RsiW